MNDSTNKILGDMDRLLLREKSLAESRAKLAQGTRLEDLIVPLHDAGLSLVESIWVLTRASGRPVNDLKNLVSTHPVWRDIVEATRPLHEELERFAESQP
jgi:hypothetical protein